MRIGVVSDTHNNLPNLRRIAELFNEAGVQRVIHTGDITQAKVLDACAAEHGFSFVDPPLVFTFAQRPIAVVHEPHQIEDEKIGLVDLSRLEPEVLLF